MKRGAFKQTVGAGFSATIHALMVILPGMIVALGMILWSFMLHAQQGALVSTDEVITQAFTQTAPITGKLTAKQSGAATARIDGTVATMLVQVGDRVASGQVLARLDTAALALQKTLAAARRDEARAKWNTAQAELTLASQQARRMRDLSGSQAISQATRDDAEQRRNIASAKAQEARAAIAIAEAALGLASIELGYAEIRAPFEGAVTERLAEVGGYLRRGEAVARLVSDQRLEVEANIPYDRLGGLTAGAEVTLRLDNGSAQTATARAIIAEEDPRTRTRRVRFSVALGEDAGLLAAEQSVTLLIPAGAKRDIISVHKDAIVRRGEDVIVFVVEDRAAVIRRVRLGESSGSRVEALAGLAPGDQAVVRGNERLQPNQPVMVAPPQ